MLIQGTILKVDPPDYQDNYGNHYQNITVQTAAGPIIGRKASKTPYGVNDINRQVEWNCEQKTNNRGPYNKFTKPQDPQYAQQGQGQPQQAVGQLNAAPQGQDRAVGMVRHGVVCAYISAGVDPDINNVNYWTEFIMTGKAPPPPGKAPEPLGQTNYPDSQVPPWES